jgi:hypothetical protein
VTYQQKDLGYPRAKTDAMLRVTMPDGSRWDVPAQVVADSRDEFYGDANGPEDTVQLIRDGQLHHGELADWAANDMNWCDVEKYATEAPRIEQPFDREEGWANGPKEILGSI